MGDVDISTLLNDDGYRLMSAGESPVPGDTVVWGNLIDVEHVGLIVDTEDLLGLNLTLPVVLSQWGPGPEYLHLIGDSPFEEEPVYYTERP